MENDYYKLKHYILPNGRILEINANVVSVFNRYKQTNTRKEAGGILIGLTSAEGNILIKKITTPTVQDERTLLSFKRKDKTHIKILKKEFTESRGILNYLGNWHSHPEDIPIPSFVDLNSWYESMNIEKIHNGYLLFIIVGRKKTRVWVGNLKNNKIEEAKEVVK